MRSTKKRANAKPKARRRLRFQRLESRQLLSADGLGLGGLESAETQTSVQPMMDLNVAEMIAPAGLKLLNNLGAYADQFQQISVELRDGGQLLSRETIPVTPGSFDSGPTPSASGNIGGDPEAGGILRIVHDRALESKPGRYPTTVDIIPGFSASTKRHASLPPVSSPVRHATPGGGTWHRTGEDLDADSDLTGIADALLGGMPDFRGDTNRLNPPADQQPRFDADLESELDVADDDSPSRPSWLSESPDAGGSMPDSPRLDADLADAGYSDWLDSQDGMRQSMDELGQLIDTLGDDLHAPPPSTELSQTVPLGSDPISPGPANLDPPAAKQLDVSTTRSTQSPQRSLPSSGEEQSSDSGGPSDSGSKAGAGDLSNRTTDDSPTKDAETKKSSETASDADTADRASQLRRLAGAGQMILLGQQAVEEEAGSLSESDSEMPISPEMLATWSYGVGLYRASDVRAFAHGQTMPNRIASQPSQAPAEDLLSAAEVETLVTVWNMPADAVEEVAEFANEPEAASTQSFDEEAFAAFLGGGSASESDEGGGNNSVVKSISTTLQVGALAAGFYAWIAARRHAGKLSPLESAHPPLA